LENWKSGVPASAVETADYPETPETQNLWPEKRKERRPSTFALLDFSDKQASYPKGFA
jgi:hypothetical protein